MINAFGFYEQYEGSRGWDWRGVVAPNPSIAFEPDVRANWLHAKTKEDLERQMIVEVRRILHDCTVAIDSLA